MNARKNLLVLLASSAATIVACGDEGDTIVRVECGGTSGESAGGKTAGGKSAGGKSAGGESNGGESAGGESNGGESAGGAPGNSGAPGQGGASGSTSAGAAGASPTAGAAGAGGETGTPTTGTSLQITITNQPAESEASVLVTGPSGFSAVISASSTFHDLEPGDYSVFARPARVDGALVDELFGATISDATPTVAQDQSVTVSVDYSATRLGGSGMLWASNSGNQQLLGYSAAQMALDGDVSEDPSVVLTLPELGSSDSLPGPIAFDPLTGNLWVGYCGTETPQAIAAFEPAALAESGSPAPLVELGSPDDSLFSCVTSLTFDAQGNLWVGFYFNRIVRYTRQQLAASGAPEPDATVGMSSLVGVQDMAFDAGGSLLVAAFETSLVLKFLPSTLAGSVSDPTPAVLWQGTNVNGPTGLAFDASENLWVAQYNDGRLLAHEPLTQFASGDPLHVASITSADVSGPQFITFDESGNLWVAAYDDSTVVRLEAADLDADVPVGAAAVYSSPDMNGSYSVRLNPSADGS